MPSRHGGAKNTKKGKSPGEKIGVAFLGGEVDVQHGQKLKRSRPESSLSGYLAYLISNHAGSILR